MEAKLHRAHHYGFLMERWRKLARSNGLRLRLIAKAGRWPVYCLITPALRRTGGIYASAGIHGDEPGGSEGLLAWAEANDGSLRDLPLFLVPCLNPWGLTNNLRFDAEHRDLNRSFHREDIPEIVSLRALAERYRFACALNLHEDYDGEGLYLYEVYRRPPYWGEQLLEAARPIIPPEPREFIDGRRAIGGLIRRRIDYARFAEIGFPEAIWLHRTNSERTFTIETPSEFALEQRSRAHAAVVAEAVRLTLASGSEE